MWPEFYFTPFPVREWRIDLKRLRGGYFPLTGVRLRGGWSVYFGPFSLFWVTE